MRSACSGADDLVMSHIDITICEPCQSLISFPAKWKPPHEFEVTFCVRGVISPLLANLYLHPVDVAVTAAGYEMIRYADDLVILCRSEVEARKALELLGELTVERGLALHPDKTRLVDVSIPGEGFDFLGYHFERGLRWPRPKSWKKLKDAIRSKTKRSNGRSLAAIIEDVNGTLRG